MRTQFLLLLLLFAGFVHGQENLKSGGNYYFNYIPAASLQYLENSSTKFDQENKTKLVEILEGNTYSMRVTKIEKDSVYFIFGEFDSIQLEQRINELDFSDRDSLAIKKRSSTKYSNKNVGRSKAVYSLLVEIFEKNTKPLYNRVEYRVGAYTYHLNYA